MGGRALVSVVGVSPGRWECRFRAMRRMGAVGGGLVGNFSSVLPCVVEHSRIVLAGDGVRRLWESKTSGGSGCRDDSQAPISP